MTERLVHFHTTKPLKDCSLRDGVEFSAWRAEVQRLCDEVGVRPSAEYLLRASYRDGMTPAKLVNSYKA